MDNLKSSTTLKAETRQLLMGKYGQFILVWMIAELLVGIPTMNVSFFSNASWQVQILSVLISIITTFLTAIITTGINYYSLNVGLNRPRRIRDVFYGFFYRANSILAINGILLIISILCFLPTIICGVLFYVVMDTAPAFTSIIFALALIASSYLYLFYFLKYRFVLFIVLDYKDATVKQIFHFSGELMKGNQLKLFYLYVTFLPYYLLSILSMGIGFLFVMPYQQMTITKFYMDLIDCYYNSLPSATPTDVVKECTEC